MAIVTYCPEQVKEVIEKEFNITFEIKEIISARDDVNLIFICGGSASQKTSELAKTIYSIREKLTLVIKH